MKIALVTDWIYGGGSELVVEALHELYPDAPIYTSYCSDEWRKRLDNKVVTGYLQRTPFKQLRKFLPLLRQWWFRGLDLSKFDTVISVTGNGEAKFVRASNGVHISYCNTPVHYYWQHYEKYLENPGFKPAWLARLGLKLLVKPLRKSDFKAAQQVDYFIANSSHIKNDIKEFYGRDSEVIFPPVDIEKFSKINVDSTIERHGFVTHGRLVPMKRVDIIIEACNDLNLPLTIIGKGPDTERLKKMAGPNVTFRGFVSDEDLPSELARHQAYIFASYEDFGIAPVEALAAGIPVIAYKAGGALDYVIPGKTGEFFDSQTSKALKNTLHAFNPKIYKDVSSNAAKFSKQVFQKNISRSIESVSTATRLVSKE